MHPVASIALFALLIPPPSKLPSALDLNGLLRPASEARAITGRFEVDLGSLLRTYPNSVSPTRHTRLKQFYASWLKALHTSSARSLSEATRQELEPLRSRIQNELTLLEGLSARQRAILPLVPFSDTIVGFEDARRRLEVIDPVRSAERVTSISTQILASRNEIERAYQLGEVTVAGLLLSRENLQFAAEATGTLSDALRRWYRFFEGYDPLFTWWVSQPQKEAVAELEKYRDYLRMLGENTPASEVTPDRHSSAVVANSASDAPDLAEILATPRSEFLPVIQRYSLDRRDRRSTGEWQLALEAFDLEKLSPTAQVDYFLLRNDVRRTLRRRELDRDPSIRPARIRDASGVDGRPIGRVALLAELAAEMIPYSPEELIAVAEQEYAWCQKELRQAAREMGYGDDWKAAVEAVKRKHVEPGKQPYLVRDLAREATDYVRVHRLVSVPPLCEECWRMEMMSAEAQRFNPFFTGGEVVTVAFPTDAMSHAAKLQSLRGNNVHFSRTTVQHELIPGHALQMFQNARYQSHRMIFNTPVWTEGWAMYWELVLYARGDFARSPEDRIGFMVWRMHRCARVVFSFRFHLGLLSPQQCVDYLVENVGFEPANSLAEVRRSLSGAYGPVYQAAYLVGALQFWAMRKELVDSGIMPEREFHDRILKENRIPLELVRAILRKQPLKKDWQPCWKFLGEPMKNSATQHPGSSTLRSP